MIFVRTVMLKPIVTLSFDSVEINLKINPRSFFKTYNAMSESCFNDCIWDFGTMKVRSREERCVSRCTTNYLQANKAIGEKVADLTVAKMTGEEQL